MSFEPRIVGFLCNWCSYAGADLAGVSRMKCAPNVHIIRTMCSGGVSPFYILKALEAGADGVIICGCNPGDCHYREGNYKTIRRMTLLKKMLGQLGIEQERVQLHWVCASCADEFIAVVNKVTSQIKELGPLQLKAKTH